MQDLRSYEAAVVLRADLSDEQIETYIARLLGIVTSQGGEPGEPDKWGRRRLAYEIDRQRDGYYAILPFKAPPDAPEELRRVMRLSEEVLRFLVVHPPKPSKSGPVKTASAGAAEAATPESAPEAAFAPRTAEKTASAAAEPPETADVGQEHADAVPSAPEAPSQPSAALSGAEQREIPD